MDITSAPSSVANTTSNGHLNQLASVSNKLLVNGNANNKNVVVGYINGTNTGKICVQKMKKQN